MALLALGSFALVGLMVTGPDMQKTGADYFEKQNTMDLGVISDLGLDKSDQAQIKKEKGLRNLEFGYLKDVTIRKTNTSVRIFSKPDQISKYKITKGRLPKNNNEITLDDNLKKKYKVGDTIKFTEAADVTGTKTLKKHEFKIVGFADTSEILSDINMGPSTAGTGELNSFGVVMPGVFDSEVYTIARMTFKDTQGVDPYSKEYTDLIQTHKTALQKLLKKQPEKRLAAIRKEYQTQIDQGASELANAKQKLSDAKAQLNSAKQQLSDGANEITENEQKLNDGVASAEQQINDGSSQIATAQTALATAEKQLAAAKSQLDSGSATLSATWKELQSAQSQLSSAKTQLDQADQTLTSGAAAINQGQQQIANGYQELAENQQTINQGLAQLPAVQTQITQKEQELAEGQTNYEQSSAALAQAKQDYAANKAKFDSAQNELTTNKAALENGKANYENSLAKLNEGIRQVKEELNNPNLTDEQKGQLNQELSKLSTQLADVQTKYNAFLPEYNSGIAQITEKQKELDRQKAVLDQAAAEIATNEQKLAAAKQTLDDGNAQLTAAKQEFAAKQQELTAGQQQLETAKAQLAQAESMLQQKISEYEAGLQQYNTGAAAYNKNQTAYYSGLSQWQAGVAKLDSSSAEYQTNAAKLSQSKTELASKEAELATAKNELATEKMTGAQQLAAAKQTLAEKQKEYDEKNQEYQTQLPDAQKKIKANEKKLKDAQKLLNDLSLPVYSVNSRREMPGADGYKVYDSVAKIVNSLATIFPIFLYFVAALVTLTTMTRFVDEERINAGTLKALGYTDRDVLKKFTVYGLTAGISGAAIGIAAGHLLMPFIVYDAYKSGFALPPIEYKFYPLITLIALVLAIVVAVVPAAIVAKRELTERPARLLLPKPPVSGSKIFLERIKPLWNRMSFTQKVTARNIFRYKRRMLMTIFGVAGSVALLFTGLAVQNSISGISQRQFGTLINYDLIASKADYLPDGAQTKIDKLLKSAAVKEESSIHYETVTKVAGANKDAQDISLIVPEKTADLSDYIKLVNRKTQNKLSIAGNGAVISERLAKLLKVGVGDSITVKDANKKQHRIKVAGITEMYIGHFIFMSKQTYEKDFSQNYETNAYMLTLKDRSRTNSKKEAAKFMKINGIQGVVQNTTQMSQIDTIVDSLNQIMLVLIIVAAVLALVILYNLTNINVSERIRELSTIKVLGFYDNEVTMYIYRETIILSILGIFVGYGLGAFLHSYILTAVPPDNTMFNPGMWSSNFTIPALITVVITALLGFVVYRRLKNVDMLEALKSVE